MNSGFIFTVGGRRRKVLSKKGRKLCKDAILEKLNIIDHEQGKNGPDSREGDKSSNKK